ncbi:MAG: cytochrome c biogenesis protein ResB, partial [Muribaculaceae bacterium]|nr:cytochrome c biogenesis protein ResB [Muribaculaceae bacterium]
MGISLLVGLSSLLPAEIYSSAIWRILWLAIGAALIFGIISGRLWRNVPAFIMHIAFLFMMAGGFCSSLLSRRGTLHLFPSQTTDCFISTNGKMEKLPSAVTLLSFAPEYYPGMNFPKDFRSELKTASGDTMHISMNHIGRLGNYRFYQTSYDDRGGTVLTVTHDPAGIALTYAGFLLFTVGGLAWLLKSFGRSRLKKPSSACILLCLICLSPGKASAVPAVDTATADSLAARQVLFNGETVSFARFADRLTHKLTGRGSVAALSPEAFVASLIKYREEWSKVPFLKVKGNALREALAIDGDYASVAALYDEDGGYIPAGLYKGGAGPLDKDILALDEKVALLIDLWNGELFTPLPPDSDSLRSGFSIGSEILYYKVNPVRVLFICAILTVALILLMHILKKNVRFFPVIAMLGLAGILAFAWLWYISGSVPLSATADIMEFVGICMILLSGVA